MNNAEDVEIIDREIYDRMIKFGVDVTGYIIKEEGENKVEKKNEQLKLRPKIPVYLEKESESEEFDAIYDYEEHNKILNDFLNKLKMIKLNDKKYFELIEDIEDELDFSLIDDEDMINMYKKYVLKCNNLYIC